MTWLVTALLATIGLSSYNFVLKLSSSKISSFYALPFLATGAFIVGLLGLVFAKVSSLEGLLFTKQGALYALVTGILWGIGEVFFFLMFSKGTPLSVGLPLVIGGLVVIGSVLGVVLLKEPVSAAKIAGICAILLGYVILSKS